MAQREVQPLNTLQELLAFKDTPLVPVEHLREVKRGGPQAPRTMFCHDMLGGYLEDRFIHGCTDPYSYRFHHWQIIDSFVYFTHHLVTIPPPGWISAGHLHGVKVLGTLHVESLCGVKFFNEMRAFRLEKMLASQLARIAALYRFDGWLVSVACKLDRSCVPVLKEFLCLVKEQTHSAVPGSLVIWYDSVVRDGKLAHQNRLNSKNVVFFDLCDGIFLNYDWTEEMLEKSARYAHYRKSDVYVGIDVFARGTDYPGGFETYAAVEQVRKHGLSAGVFAAGWVYEMHGKDNFADNQCRLWNFPDQLCNEWRLTTLPLKTGFCQGFGEKFYKDGRIASSIPWYNLAKQQLQPRDQGMGLCLGCGSATVDTTTAYNGGGCLRLQFEPKEAGARPYFRLFGCELPLGTLSITYVYQPGCVDSVEHGFSIVLAVRSREGEKRTIRLGLAVTSPDEERYAVVRDYGYSPFADQDMIGFYWFPRKYTVRDLSGNATLEEIGAAFESCAAYSCLLGELVVEQADGARASNAEEDSDEGLDMASDEDDGNEPSAKLMRF
ncbi:cytosolic endo-beta-N-acetylglucosaminidase-like isoform X1 [Dermacentor albipictus]|uniref:cytosolic endo-beta-N-acetylglucosaminidase-like isoform X1 n=1 Tax=Dermacentor albipictus TaxID=60249 RepID=UPI0038FC03A6